MDGGNCQKCPKSPWVQRANEYVKSKKNRKDRVETVKFLLQNGHCGIKHRVSEPTIIKYLKSKHFIDYSDTNVPKFQQEILTVLKRNGILATLIYGGWPGGVFIPCNEDDLKEVCEDVFERIVQLLSNLEGVVTETKFHDAVSSARECVRKIGEDSDLLVPTHSQA